MDNKEYPQTYFSRTTHIIYQSISRTCWGLGLGYIIFACETGNGGGFLLKLKSLEQNVCGLLVANAFL